MDTPGSFGDWLKTRRKALDLTQEELARRAGCSIFALRKIESEERRPSKQLAALLADALEIQNEEKQAFIRAARGELSAERLRAQVPNPPLISFPDHKPSSQHLPLPATPLLGRETELAALERLFKDPQCRLLTLTGMGGIGKTRLAIEFASRQQGLFAEGVYYTPLAAINTAELIVPAIAEAFGFSFSGPVDPKEQLIGYLQDEMKHSMLLVLDNFEHLLVPSSEAVELVSEFLKRLPRLKILATSRERLNLQGEWMYELHGLPVPPTEYIEKLDGYSAAVLFVQSARRVRTDFEIGEEKAALIHICQLLEGIPLAIELAAAWVAILSCTEISRELESNLDFLQTNMRDIPERHRSLRASFDHSWRLLSEPERTALSRLAVFRGGFDRSAADQVAGATLPLLASLISKSLVRRGEDGRYDLHEVIRQLALSYLHADPSLMQDAHDAHTDYYLQFAAERERALRSATQQQAARELIQEIDNVRAAWVWAIRHEQFQRLGSTVRSLAWFFEVTGLIREGIEQFEPLVRVLKAKPQYRKWRWVLGQTLTHQGMLYFRKGFFDRAQALMEESLAILRPLGRQDLLTDALVYLGIIMHLNGDIERSRTLMEQGLACARAMNDEWFMAYAIFNLGYLDGLMGRYEQGRPKMQQGIALWRKLGDPHSIALGLNHLGPTLVRLGCYEEAETSLEESLRLCKQSGNRWGMGTAYRYWGLAKMAQGKLEDARSLFQKSIDTFGDYFIGWDIARSATYLAETHRLADDLVESRRVYMEALHISKEAESIPLMLDSLAGLAQLDLQGHVYQQAFEVSNFVQKHAASTQETKDRAYQISLEAEKHLSSDEVQEIKEKTANQSWEMIVNRLLSA